MKRLLLILLGLALIAPLAGCNGDEDDDTATADNGQQATADNGQQATADNGQQATADNGQQATTDNGDTDWDWSAFAPGSYVVYRGPMGTIKRTVRSVEDDVVVTEVVLQTPQGDSPAETETYAVDAEPWAMDQEQQQANPNVPQPQAKKVGTEEITVPAGTFQTTVYEVTQQTPQGQAKMTLYTSKDVPGHVVKMVLINPMRESEKVEIVLHEFEAK